MYEKMDVFLMIDKMALPHFVEDALNNGAIPFVVIRNKKIVNQILQRIKKPYEEGCKPTEVVLTLNYLEDKYIN